MKKTDLILPEVALIASTRDAGSRSRSAIDGQIA